jgi:hypothetical protein
MAHYKIKNITDKFGKRHVNKDSVLNIEYHVGFQKKYRRLAAGDEIVLSCRTLPVSIHTLRAKKMITVMEISENEFARLQKPSARKKETPKAEVKTVEVVDEVPEETTTTTTKKPTKRKSNKTSTSTVIVKDEE